MARFPNSAAFIAIALMTTACGPETNRLTPISNPSLYSVNQPIVQRTDYVLDLAATGNGISDYELGRLAGWFESLQLGYGDKIAVDQGPNYADPESKRDIADVAAEFGLLLSEGAPITGGAVQPGSLRVIVSRTSASVPGCPIWDDEMVGAPERTASNYGCAVNSNLAAMIADPNDLVLGQRRDGVGDPREAARAVTSYRNRAPTSFNSLKSESAGSK